MDNGIKKRLAILLMVMALAYHTAKAEMQAVQIHSSQVHNTIKNLSYDHNIIDIVPYVKAVKVTKTNWSILHSTYTGEQRDNHTFFVITYMPKVVLD